MAKLTARERAALPDDAFAYVDGNGKRSLPIHDAGHVRNALARFEQTAFVDDAARDRARQRLLKAAKRFGIVPLGFMASQLRAERARAGRGIDVASLPAGIVTFMLTDIENSTPLVDRLGDGYARVLSSVRRTIREAVRGAGGREVDARADEFFAVFERPGDAIAAGIELQRRLAGRRWPDDAVVRVRAGIHTGEAAVVEGGYVGLTVHAAARVCFAGHGGQIVISGETKTAAGRSLPDGVRLRSLGRHQLRGLPAAMELLQVGADGLAMEFPRPRT